MTTKKQLLFKDLCARLPYGVRYKGDGEWGINPYVHTTSLCTITASEEPLIYLRSMSSMTEKEENEYRAINCYEGLFPCNEEALDYILEHHFDFRGLIGKGLALEMPSDMYK